MEKWDLMTLSNVLWDNTLFGITEIEHIFIRMNLQDGKIECLDNPINYSPNEWKGTDQILFDPNGSMYILELDGNRLMRYLFKENLCRFIRLDCKSHICCNFVKMVKYEDYIYFFLCYENAILKLNTKTEQYKRIELSDIEAEYSFEEADVPKKLYSSACLVENDIWLFAERQKYVVRYHLKEEIYERYALPEVIGGCADVIYLEDRFYILSLEGKVYSWNAINYDIEEIWDNTEYPEYPCFGKIIVTAKKIWVLPILGQDIIVINRNDKRASKYCDYPKDFKYYCRDLYSKYHYFCEDAENYYLAMHAGNYLLTINKQSGTGKWIEPIQPSTKEKTLFYNKNDWTIINEIYGYSLNALINAIDLFSHGRKEKERTSIGKKIWRNAKGDAEYESM